ncbi:hypothetical protein BDW42DRAFT_201081 [Aspergillus taichungensis]|uniref:Uncharacterized protein n=1 Tax=Aspergillus taichungensis TaxID=482145 RepID=A0A2J5HU14_9EURO|nr:hypothetical protein BDW42DRAFT_201081 [Aspergillus taichungensis]
MSLPKTQQEWSCQAQAADVHNRSLKSCSTLQSGSRVNHQQFLLFRTIVPDIQQMSQLDTSQYGLQMHMQEASQILNNPEFNRYLMAIQSANWVSLHDFRNILRAQIEVLAGQQQTHLLRRIDETAWRSSRITLTANFGTMNSRQAGSGADGSMGEGIPRSYYSYF